MERFAKFSAPPAPQGQPQQQEQQQQPQQQQVEQPSPAQQWGSPTPSSAAGSCAPEWQACKGNCCMTGCTCTPRGPTYSQCVPNSGSTCAAPAQWYSSSSKGNLLGEVAVRSRFVGGRALVLVASF